MHIGSFIIKIYIVKFEHIGIKINGEKYKNPDEYLYSSSLLALLIYYRLFGTVEVSVSDKSL